MNEPSQRNDHAPQEDAATPQPSKVLGGQLTCRERAILNNLSHGVVAIDLQQSITLFNPAAERMFGYRAEEIIGREPSTLYAAGTLEQIVNTLLDQNLPLAMAGMIALTRSPLSTWMYLRKDNTQFLGRLSITELCSEEGVAFGYLALITDLSDRPRIAEMDLHKEALIGHISRGTNAAVGKQFFNQLLNELQQALGAHYVDIFVRLPDDPQGTRGTVLNRPTLNALNGIVDLAGTPVESVLRDGKTLHLVDARTTFPQLIAVRELQVQEVILVPLVASDGAMLGALIVAHREPLPEPELALHLLEIFAVRVTSELERTQAELAMQTRAAAQRWLYAASERIHAQSDVAGVARETVAALAQLDTQPFVTMALGKPDGYHILDYAGPPDQAPHHRTYPLLPELMHKIVQTGHSMLLVPDYLATLTGAAAKEAAQRRMHAAVLIALIDRDQGIGALILGYSDPAALAKLDLDTLTMFSRAATLALGRALHRQELEYQADHDSLTGLFNRTVLHREFDRWREQGGTHTALLLLDLDRFKEVNDTFGHHVGDALLRQIGARLRTGINYSKATLSRLGGDEFAVLLRGRKIDAERAHALAEGMLTALRQPFQINGVNLEIGASVGVAMYPEHGGDSHALLRSADVAMYEAKRGGGGVAFYNRSLDFNSPERLALIAEVSAGIRQREFELFYQPKIDLHTQRVIGFEGLLRWRHPRLGLLPPDRFLALIEMSDAIHDLTAMVLELACEQMRTWLAAGTVTNLAVNLSARNLIDDRVVRQLAGLLPFYQIPGDRLELEITETALIQDPEYAQHLLQRIAAFGVKLSIDDFGTGYSSLASLRQMPISSLKIDRTFIRDLLINAQDQLIVRSIVQLAHSLGMRVIAEGVESAEVMAQLCVMGCDQAQGYHFTRPLPIGELQVWLADASVAGHAPVSAAQ